MACTANARCVKVAQPSPKSPGSDVSTLTTTRRSRVGWTTKLFRSVIVMAAGMRAA